MKLEKEQYYNSIYNRRRHLNQNINNSSEEAIRRLREQKKNRENSSTIHTEHSTLQRKEVKPKVYKKEIPSNLMINTLLNVRGYDQLIDDNNQDIATYTNGKSTITIPKGIESYYYFDEIFENQDIQSKGYFLSQDLGKTTIFEENYHTHPSYHGSTYYKQAFKYGNEIIVISFIVRKDHYVRGWACMNPVYEMYIKIEHYDLNYNTYFINHTNLLESFLDEDSYIKETTPLDYSQKLLVSKEAVGEPHEAWDSRFYKGSAKYHEHEIEKLLKKSYKIIEKIFDTKLETKNNMLTKVFSQK